tara:strand:+ start:1001 stop:1735 length:735 start_codon:yes stop_codon:yes gene_type:complete
MKLDNHFSIIITSYNCEKWVEKNVSSVLEQTYQNYQVYYIDDNSSDDTTKRVLSFESDKITTINNYFSKGKMQNLVEVNKLLDDDTIAVILDGDDWLYNNDVLDCLNEVYQNKDIWMTNGSYIIEPTGQVIKPQINDQYWSNNIRKKSWEFSHLGTFKKKLFDKVKKKHFMSPIGQYWATTSDQAIMWPMAEMSGPQNHKVINEILYSYNRLNPLSDDRMNRQDQLLTETLIRKIKPYEKINQI